jgi:HEAT repeat protein
MVDGKVILCGAGGKAVRGRLGFYAAHTSETAFDNAALRFPPPPTPVYIQHEVFKGEKTMANWSAAQSDWVQVAWNGLQTNWHRGSFPGDVCVRARLRDKEIAAGGLSVCVGAVDNDPAKGHVFSVAVGKTGVYLKIQHGDQVLAERTDVPITLPGALAFTRHGDFLTIEANGLPLLYARVHEAVRGTEVGWWANGIQFTSEDVEILSSRCEVHTFNSAPVDWVPASGTWEVSNRWTCDPRWSFFSGLSANLAALWNKRPLRGDVTVEFAAGIKMDNARGGGSYAQYASDINVTLCGDGKDLTTGYNFIFGGWHNTVTRILRNNQVVAETKSSLIPAGSLHRLWLYFKAERRGKELRFWVDNNLVLRYEDPEPLPGDRVALWTWQNGVMVARVRVSAEEVLNPSLPQPEAPTWGTCVYNHPGQPGLVQPQVERLKAESAEEIGGAAFELAKLREPSTIAALVPVLQHGDENCRWQAAAALAAIGLPGVEALLKALDTPNEQVRWKAEAALRQSGPEAVHLFDKVLRAGTPVQRRSCAFILRDIPCEETYRALAHALADEDDDVRWKTADSLVRFGTPVIPSIERALRTEDVRARQAAAWVLHQVGTEAAIKPLLGALNDPDKDVRWKAAIALKEMDPRPTTALLEVVKEAGKCPREHIEWILREWKVKNTNRSRTTTEEASRSGGKQDKNRGKLVRIESEPAGASVFLNDRFLCATPGEFRLQDPGRQLLVVERAGYARVCRAIEPAQAEDMKLVLAPEPTLSLTVVSSPSFASVYLDEELKGKTPLRIAGVAAGLHTLRLVKEDCFPLQQPMELAPNQDRELRLSLTFKAEQFYLDSLKGDTNNASFRTELAHLYLLRNAFDLARDQLIQAYRLVGEGKDTGGYAGRLQQEVQKAMAAFFDYGDEKAVAEGQRMLESVFLTLIKESPTNATYWLSLATTQQQRGAWAESVKTLLDGTKQVPNDWTLFYYLGVAQYTLATQGQKGLKAEALASLQKSRTLTGEAAHHKQIDHYIAAANQLAN